jgi:hypothetical protein
MSPVRSNEILSVRPFCRKGAAVVRPLIKLVVATLVAVSSSLLVAPAPGPSQAAGCTVTARLVNPCRPWLGAYAGHYKGASGWGGQIAAHEKRIGRPLDIVHSYHPVGADSVTSSEAGYAKRPNTIVMMNWRPSDHWAAATGGNATVNARIDHLAKSVKALGSKKIIINLAHEPENDVSSGGTGCTSSRFYYKGHSGTPAAYRGMWKNVHKRFAAVGATNVVWAVNFQGYDLRYCLIDDLWPGNSLVDWVFFDSYGSGTSANFVKLMARFYNFMTATSNTSHSYLSKPWGVGEWNTKSSSAASEANFYTQARSAVNNNRFPRIKAWVIWDSASGSDFRTSYYNWSYSSAKASAYKAFARSAAFR